MALAGPITAASIAATFAITEFDANAALLALESDGAVIRGSFENFKGPLEWCDRRLLARIHRYTLTRLRAEIEPVSPADFMRFLFAWQHVEPSSRLSGLDGLRTIVATLDGFELAATAWERAVLPARMDRYDPAMLDMLCLTGEVGWARLSPPRPDQGVPAEPPSRLVGATPIALFLREHGNLWQELRQGGASDCRETLSADARVLLDTLQARGASFLRELGL